MEKKNYCEWKFYAINQENKLVLGFSDEADAKQYCKNINSECSQGMD